MTLKSLVILSALALATACSSVEVVGAEFGGPPRTRHAFPPQTLEGIVYAQARFADHEAELGVDLVEEVAVVPVRIRVQLRGRGADEAQILLNPTRMRLRLVLSDGAELAPVDLDDVVRDLDEDVAGAVRRLAFRGGLLEETPSEGYVFFSLAPPSEFAMDGRIIRHGERGVVRSLDVADSLLTFDLAIGSDSAQHPFYVGIER